MTAFLLRTAFGLLYAGLWLSTLWMGSGFYVVFVLGLSILVIKEFMSLHNIRAWWKAVLVGACTYGLFQAKVPQIIWAFGAVLAQIYFAYHMLTQKKWHTNTLQTMAMACTHIGVPMLLLLPAGSEGTVMNLDLITGILLLVWTTDSVAFVFGSWLGKRPLYTLVSPNKTIEGAIAAICIAPIMGFGIAQYSQVLSSNSWLIVGLLIAVLSIIGDLTQSHIKRMANVKDSGKLMPGHGGLYDRTDSLIFVIPFLYIIIYYTT